jgi:hypothetical protein
LAVVGDEVPAHIPQVERGRPVGRLGPVHHAGQPTPGPERVLGW